MTNICRCGTYNRVRAAIKAVAQGGNVKQAGLAIEHVDGSTIMTTRISRRRFLGASAAAAGSLVVGFHIPFAGVRASAQGSAPPEINAWVVVQPDDTVVIRIARSEMGQGTLTGLAQLVAEELDCDWAKVTTEYPTPGAESRAQPRLGQLLDRRQPRHPRFAGLRAQGRRDGAHDARAGRGGRLEGPRVRMRRGQQRDHAHAHRAARVTYGKVAAAAAKVTPPADVPLKDPKDWKIAGKRLARLDTVDKTTGKQIYGMDLVLPGMLNAAIKDCPVFGGKVKSVDAAAAMKRPGVKKVVRVGDSAVAVVADTWWHAKSALDALPIEWDYGPNADASSAKFAAVLKAGLRRDGCGRSATRSATRAPRSPRRRARSRRSTRIRTRTTRRWRR